MGTTKVISRDRIGCPDDRGSCSAFASDLGLRPGEWPDVLTADIVGDGRGQDFFRGAAERDAEGDLTSVAYATAGRTARITVWND